MTSATIDRFLKGIGCNMLAAPPHAHFPEECLIELSNSILNDPKALVLTIGAIQRHSGLLHPEILLKLLKLRHNDPNVIGSLLLKTKDRRFTKTIQYCRETKFKSKLPTNVLVLATKIGQADFDSEFALFGIKITKMDPVNEKKITTREAWAENNIFIRNRILYGCNWRADVISAIESGYDNPTAIKNRIHCSYETAHRVHKDYLTIQKIENSVA
jgi:hypothetical protein